MQDAMVILRHIEQYEEALHLACLAPRTGRIVPLRCEAFTNLYDSLRRDPRLEGPARRLVHSHWTANAVIEGLRSTGRAADVVPQLGRLRQEIHGQLRAIRRSLARHSGSPGPRAGWLRALLVRPRA